MDDNTVNLEMMAMTLCTFFLFGRSITLFLETSSTLLLETSNTLLPDASTGHLNGDSERNVDGDRSDGDRSDSERNEDIDAAPVIVVDVDLNNDGVDLSNDGDRETASISISKAL